MFVCSDFSVFKTPTAVIHKHQGNPTRARKDPWRNSTGAPQVSYPKIQEICRTPATYKDQAGTVKESNRKYANSL